MSRPGDCDSEVQDEESGGLVGPEPDEYETLIASMGMVDHRGVDWGNVRWTAYLVHQHMRYEYPGPIRNLHQRLVVIPPPRHGDQRLVTHKLEVSSPGAEVAEERDASGNLILSVTVPEVAAAIDFTAWIVVEREGPSGPIPVDAATIANPGLRAHSRLTTPDRALEDAATSLASDGDDLALARTISRWVHERMRYEHGATGVRTDAATALGLGKGVCQDYAHIMLALCHLRRLAARYVSGHLLGEGGTHAWVEVLLPDPGDPSGERFLAYPFDPTNDTEPGLNYITVAVGRDYGDVAPTSGTFTAPFGGQLSAKKRAGLTALEYFPVS